MAPEVTTALDILDENLDVVGTEACKAIYDVELPDATEDDESPSETTNIAYLLNNILLVSQLQAKAVVQVGRSLAAIEEALSGNIGGVPEEKTPNGADAVLVG